VQPPLACTVRGCDRPLAREERRLICAAGHTFEGGFPTPGTVQKAYDEAVTYVQNNEFQDSSVINSSIISAVRGNYGDYHLTEKTKRSQLWISPLMPMYW